MQIGLIGLGAVVETAYLPALQRSGMPDLQCYGFDIEPLRQPGGVKRCASLADLLAKPLDMVFVTTSSTQHLAALEQALASPVQRIVVEKPVVASLAQMAHLKTLLAQTNTAPRVLALDHWMARSSALPATGTDSSGWISADISSSIKPQLRLADVTHIEGFLQEPSGFNDQGESIALNFATGAPDTRQLCHPDGVILDTGTHVLALLREIVSQLGGDDSLELRLVAAQDRLGQPIERGDTQTAEGSAHLQGQISGIPLDIWLDKYAGPQGGQKGWRIHLRDGRIVSLDRRGNADVVELQDGGLVTSWQRPGPIYDHCLRALLTDDGKLFAQAAVMTRRRMAEVEALLQLQQGLRGPH
ncbi:Gfo/Idh/MocA family oxidoreductase [Silvimonas soli]|uniref:Gfo/Idh/MocA family oxidoreductase n=1 Tax=Silvimonas soli TaxID=2980100 RepID=UPI0024B3B429|nr:Gfo/Idh/MocA family oxidoreductase [Silvimonas soli]